ncbi:hypothetical protein [Massilia cavernae]|uniref:hypothetical protein n=1 Tax=Massilia cavernae TaxID=2320864 RepID=UPI001600D4A0|nr:hypothetical protein [Massilia cavernae]
MPLLPKILDALAYVSRACGFETVNSFPAGHAYARTHWNPAYFDIASDLKPDAIERSLCESIANTPTVFAHIANPTPRMQRALLGVIEARVRRSCGNPVDLMALLINAYASPHTQEAIPGLRARIAQSAHEDLAARSRDLLHFLGGMHSAFDVIEAQA